MLKIQLSQIMHSVRRDASLLKNLFEANREAAVTTENPRGAGDDVFKNNLTVSVADEAKQVIKERLVELKNNTVLMTDALINDNNNKKRS